MAKTKRVSSKVHYCSKHGKFVGYKWCGHRRLCHAAETTAEKYEKSIKAIVAAVSKIETTTTIYPRSPKILLKTMEGRLKKLDSQIHRITKSVQRQSALAEKAREKMMSLGKLKQAAVMERGSLMDGMEKLLNGKSE